MLDQSIKELAPCGVYCGACPSFNKSCFGCSSDNDEKGRRKSRIGCKIRECSHNKNLFCAECDQFPCSIFFKKLINPHSEDARYKYRHELPEIAKQFNKMKTEDFLQFQKDRWKCPSCGGVVHFYQYQCGQCGKSVDV